MLRHQEDMDLAPAKEFRWRAFFKIAELSAMETLFRSFSLLWMEQEQEHDRAVVETQRSEKEDPEILSAKLCVGANL